MYLVVNLTKYFWSKLYYYLDQWNGLVEICPVWYWVWKHNFGCLSFCWECDLSILMRFRKWFDWIIICLFSSGAKNLVGFEPQSSPYYTHFKHSTTNSVYLTASKLSPNCLFQSNPDSCFDGRRRVYSCCWIRCFGYGCPCFGRRCAPWIARNYLSYDSITKAAIHGVNMA